MDTEYTTHHVSTPLFKDLRLERVKILSDPISFGRFLRDISQTESVKTVKSFECHLWQHSPAPLGEFLQLAGPILCDLGLHMQDERMLEVLVKGW